MKYETVPVKATKLICSWQFAVAGRKRAGLALTRCRCSEPQIACTGTGSAEQPCGNSFPSRLEGISDSVKLAIVNALAAFHRNAGRRDASACNLWDRGRRTFHLKRCNYSAMRPAVPNSQTIRRPAFPW